MDLGKIRTDTNGRIAIPDLEMLIRVCDWTAAKNILEIGSADGGSSIVLATKAQERGGILYCIEGQPRQRMVDNMHAHGLDEAFRLYPAYSPWLGDLENHIPDGLDVLFIDGCHDVRWCLVDYHYWSPRLRSGGVVVFHDTGGNCKEDRRQPDYRQPGYVPLVCRAIDIIRETDALVEVDRSDAEMGGAIAYSMP
ncbi:MAG: class I SAM-dependent methyltransferase [Planctomycetota bacterium]|jgi:predicted O-methyltransferase YrrM